MRKRRREETPFSLFAFQDIITSVTGILLLIMLLLCLSLAAQNLTNDPPVETQESPSVANARQLKDLQERVSQLQETLEQKQRQRELEESLTPELATRRAEALESELKSLEQQIAAIEPSVKAAARQANRKPTAVETSQQKSLKIKQMQLKSIQTKLVTLRNSDQMIFSPSPFDSRQAWLVQLEGKYILVAKANSQVKPQKFSTMTFFLLWVGKSLRPKTDYFVVFVKPGGVDSYHRLLEKLHDRNFRCGLDVLGREQIVIDPQLGTGGPS